MKVQCLGESSYGSCLLIKHKNVTLLVDPALDLNPVLNFVPQETIYGVTSSSFVEHKGKQQESLRRGKRSQNNTFVSENHSRDDCNRLIKANLPFQDTSKEESNHMFPPQRIRNANGKFLLNQKAEFRTPLFELVDLSEIDVILVSNSASISALPFITEGGLFSGLVYATEPTAQLGYHYMEELIGYSQLSFCSDAFDWKQHPDKFDISFLRKLSEEKDGLLWKKLYSQEDLKNSMSKVQSISFNEIIDVFGLFTVTPISSGYCIGSCNWLIKSETNKIIIMPASSPSTQRHPLPLDTDLLKSCDAMIINGVSPYLNIKVQDCINEICRDVAMTLSQGGNVLFPVLPYGTVYDLIEILNEHLNNLDMQGINFYFISPSAKASLAYSNIYSEWLSTNKAERVFLPEPPFLHDDLIKAKRLQVIDSIEKTDLVRKMNGPCVVFAGDPSLRFGDACFFLNLWKTNHKNLVIFTDPTFPFEDCLAPYSPMSMKIKICLIDPRLNLQEVNNLIENIEPKTVLLPLPYVNGTHCNISNDEENFQIVSKTSQIIPYSLSEQIKIDLDNTYQRASMSVDLASSLNTFKVNSEIVACSVRARMSLFDNECTISTTFDNNLISKRNVVGLLSVDQLVDDVLNNLVGDINVSEQQSNHYTIQLPTLNASVVITPDSTHVETYDNEKLRHQVKELILQHLVKL